MTKNVAALALLGVALTSQGALAQPSVGVTVGVTVITTEPASREVCNRYTCWTEQGGAPRYRRVDESIERYNRTTVERR